MPNQHLFGQVIYNYQSSGSCTPLLTQCWMSAQTYSEYSIVYLHRSVVPTEDYCASILRNTRLFTIKLKLEFNAQLSECCTINYKLKLLKTALQNCPLSSYNSQAVDIWTKYMICYPHMQNQTPLPSNVAHISCTRSCSNDN